MADPKPKESSDKGKGAAYDSWKVSDPEGKSAPPPAPPKSKTTIKGKFSAMVDRFIRKFNTDKGWYDE